MTNKPHAYLFGDGSSGSKYDIGAWASFAVTESSRKLLYGVSYPTTITRCELFPIIEGLRWIKANWAHGRGFRVCVISDSEYTVKTLCGLYERRKHKELWAAVDEAADGMSVNYTWRSRNTLPYMTLCDSVCGMLRKQMVKVISQIASDPGNPEADIPMGEIPEDLKDEKTKGLEI